MSWQLAAFSILGLGLLAGFWWYERIRPDARLVALVGTLAAFGALGRIAFAAVPNVKPTGDIVLISGYALGGAPGFVVGAVSALTSNLFFGQGPWTPWQMAGWGLTGVIGAGLALITRGRIARWPLAIVCFVLGFAFTALQDFGDWVTYSDHSFGALGVYVGKGLGFDLIYATGCLAFALAFGPALNRSLQRFSERLNVTWLTPRERVDGDDESERNEVPGSRRRMPAAGVTTALLLGIVLLTYVAGAAGPVDARGAGTAGAGTARGPVSYLERAEHRNGGLGMAPGQAPNLLATGWATMALATAPGLQEYVHGAAGGKTPVAYLVKTIKQERDPGSIERTALALAAAGVLLTHVDGVDLKRKIAALVGRNGSVKSQTNLTAFGVLALRATGLQVPARTIRWLAGQRDGDGGFNFETGGKSIPSDPDDTGAVLEALAGTGHRTVVTGAVAYLRKQQNRDGGLPDEDGAASNTQSTAFAVQGLDAVGVKLTTFHKPGGKTPLQYLRSLIASNGAVAYARGERQTPVWVTAEVQLALAGRPLPLKSNPPRTGGSRTTTATRTQTPVQTTRLARITNEIGQKVFDLIRNW